MQSFLLIFESLDYSVFKTINHVKNHLDIVFKGKYNLKIEFNGTENNLSKKYNLRGAPALIHQESHKIMYGTKIDRAQIKNIII